MAGDAVQDCESWVPEMRPVMGKHWTRCVSLEWDNFENEIIDIYMKGA
jgi:hypothetical protein